MKKKTTDRGRFHTVEDIGEKRSTTPEGFLVCHDVPIARTGMQLYSSDEVPLEDAGNGEVRVYRDPEEVFRPETIASFEGKAVTVEHPNDFVTPDNWQQLAVGTVQNVRRGEGLQDDLLIADLVITDAAAIKYVNEELPEVSAGYEAAYEQDEPGRGSQRDIVGNHVALVERGRAGPRCSIQDKETIMTKRTFWDRLMTAVKAKDAEAIAAELKEAQQAKADDEGSTEEKVDNDLDRQVLARIERLEAAVGKLVEGLSKDADEETEPTVEAEEKTGDEEGEEMQEEEQTADTVVEAETAQSNSEAKGSVLSGDSLKLVKSRAELLVPGASMKTADAKKAEKAEIATFMRSTLDKAYATEGGKKAIEPFLAGRDIKTLTGDSLASVFIGAAELMRVQNNARMGRSSAVTKDFGSTVTASDMNARNREFWAQRNAR
jgi:uncharacterized protein